MESCPNCGAPITNVDRFCQNCGVPLRGDAAATGPRPADPPPEPPRPTAPAGFPPPPVGGPYGAAPSWAVATPAALRTNASGDAPAGVQPLLEYDVAYPARLSRLLIFVKWLLVIPHLFVLLFLGIGLYVVTFVAWFAILFTGRYPRGMWGFTVKTLRWSANVNAYTGLQRDEYPPFGGSEPYPVAFQLDYPTRLSRLLIFVKWLLVIPHLIILYVIGAIAGIALVIAWFAILFTGRMPRGLHDFVTGYHRWLYRAMTYLLLLTDAYPPFTMDHVPSPSRAGNRTALPS